jgi:hypothetical protein
VSVPEALAERIHTRGIAEVAKSRCRFMFFAPRAAKSEGDELRNGSTPL